MILRAYKYRIYPDEVQQELLAKSFGCVRFVWNKLVENFNSWTPESTPERVTEKTLKDSDEFSWLNEVSAAILQQKRIDFDRTKSQFFSKSRKKKLGRMSFKTRRNTQSFRLPNQKFHLDAENGTIRLEKIGHVCVVVDRAPTESAKPMSVTVSKTATGKYYASVLVEETTDLLPLTGKEIGVDLGIESLFSFSDGKKTDNPKWVRENQAKLSRAQKHLSRKEKGSNRYIKQRRKVALIHEETKNKRTHLLHEISSRLVKENDLIAVEDLNVSGLVKNRKLASAIASASWSSFVSMLEYKCNWYGKTFVRVGRFYPSSKTCSCCGNCVTELPLAIREWTCPECNSLHDRDINAAKNILAEAKRIISAELVDYAHGGDVRHGSDFHEVQTPVKCVDKFICLS